MTTDRQTFYQDRIASCDSQLVELERMGVILSRCRGLTFFFTVLLMVFGRFGDFASSACYLLAAISFAAFLALIIYHESIIVRDKVIRQRRRINREQFYRLQRDWTRISEQPIEVPATHASLANDLDLFGHASLYQLLCNAYTPMGRRMLRDWLLEPAASDEVVSRQEAVQALAELVEFREELSMHARLIADSGAGPDAFIDWVEGATWLEGRPWIRWGTRLLAFAVSVCIVLLLTGLTPAFSTGVALVGFVITSMLVNVMYTGQIHEIFNAVNTKHHEVQIYQRMLDAILDLPFECDQINKLKAKLGPTAHAPRKTLRSLSRIMRFANLRQSAFFGVFHIVFQIAFMIDYHVLAALEVWQRRHRNDVRPWFEAIGELECLASLATLSFDHPDWCWPEAAEGGLLRGEAMGHPLLNRSKCVANDVALGPTGTFLLVTGSNMSGKSTLLRSIGLNTILAQAGSAICAKSFSAPTVVIATSMRIHDSLEDGVSFFMAELKRLKEIVDQSRDYRGNSNRTLLFLLDEILQGTNSIERHLAVAQVLSRLVQNNAMGAVSTHDLELANSESLAAVCQNVHFRETIEGVGKNRRMTFDYQMRPGLATTTNALKLLELIGIVDHDDSE